jgi:hypothetical protein
MTDETTAEAGGDTDVVDEPEREQYGPIVDTIAPRITIRYPADQTDDEKEANAELVKKLDLTNPTIAAVVKAAVENHIDRHSDAIAQAGFTVNVTAEKV